MIQSKIHCQRYSCWISYLSNPSVMRWHVYWSLAQLVEKFDTAPELGLFAPYGAICRAHCVWTLSTYTRLMKRCSAARLCNE